MDVNKMAEAVFANVRGYVAKAIAPLAERLDEFSERLKAIEDRPPPEPGKDAQPEQIDAAVDKRLPDLVEGIHADLMERLDAAVKAIPTPKDGEDGKSIEVEDIHPVLMLELGKWALDFERRAQDVLLKAIAQIPEPAPGRDALQIEDFDLSLEGRSLKISLKRDDVEVSKTVRLDTVLDAGFYQPGKTYERGDGVTFGGSYWIAQKDAESEPAVGNDDWRLAVRKGRDARMVQTGGQKQNKPVRIGEAQ